MKRLALLDLDLTLFDYTAARTGATRAALTALGLESDADRLCRFLDSTLVPYSQFLLELGLPDFRREWRAPELFALLATLASSPQKTQCMLRVRRSLAQVAMRIRDHESAATFCARARRWRSLLEHREQGVLAEILLAVKTRLERDRLEAGSAIQAFDRYVRENVRLLPGVQDLLHALRTQAFEVFVVSEGDGGIQSAKAAILDLEKDIDGMFVSGECGQADRLLEWLWRQARRSMSDSSGPSARTLQDAIAVVYDEVLPYSIKTPTFFRKIAHSILLPRQKRGAFFRRFGWLSRSDCLGHGPVSVLLFGDRYDKDILPATLVFHNAVSIRLLAGKYRSTYPRREVAQLRLPVPSVTVKSLAKATEFVRNLDRLDTRDVTAIAARPASAARQRRLGQAVRTLSKNLISSPRWLFNLLEDLVRAQHGST